MKTTSYRPLSATPIKGIEGHIIECNPQMFAMWLNDMAELLNYTNQVAVDLYNENLETRRKVDCLLADLENLKARMEANVKTVETYEERLSFIENNLGGSGNMMKVLEDKIDLFQNMLPMPIADIPKGWTLAGGNITKLDEGDRGSYPADIYYPIKKLFDGKANK